MNRNIALKIGDLTARIPVIQGGMGVGVSLSSLAGSVALNGGVGVISSAQIGFKDPMWDVSPVETNLRVLQEEICKAKEIAKGCGIIAVNIMVATRFYEKYVKAAVEAGADMIISGAGLPDMVVIEGPMAGGHLGFKPEELSDVGAMNFDEEVKKIIGRVRETEEGGRIPVVAAGGIYEGKDAIPYLEMGADAVQVATRFVTTYECDADIRYKEAYIQAKKEDIIIVKSPVGMPGRAIKNLFLEKVAKAEVVKDKCHQCLAKCNPMEIPYCITDALINAVKGMTQDGLLFCGANAYKATTLEHVADIMKEFEEELS